VSPPHPSGAPKAFATGSCIHSPAAFRPVHRALAAGEGSCQCSSYFCSKIQQRLGKEFDRNCRKFALEREKGYSFLGTVTMADGDANELSCFWLPPSPSRPGSLRQARQHRLPSASPSPCQAPPLQTAEPHGTSPRHITPCWRSKGALASCLPQLLGEGK